MADFLTAYNKTMNAEGGYANDPLDHGGETYRGIARNINSHWSGWSIVDSYKSKVGFPKNLDQDTNLQQLVRDYFKTNYWDVYSLDKLSVQFMANELFDTGVNCGTSTSAKFFQRVLKIMSDKTLTIDGKVGDKTLAAFEKLSPRDKYDVWILFNALQGEKYIAICENNPSQDRFIRSWTSRVFENEQ